MQIAEGGADGPAAKAEGKGKGKKAPGAHAEEVAQRMPYYQKRIELFEHCHAREVEAMEKAKVRRRFGCSANS